LLNIISFPVDVFFDVIVFVKFNRVVFPVVTTLPAIYVNVAAAK